MKLHRVFISLPLIGLGLIAFVPLFWSAVQLVSGDVPAQQSPRLATTPYTTMPAPTPMTTPLVSDHVLLQDARVQSEADTIALDATAQAMQAQADYLRRVAEDADTQQALTLIRQAQQYENELLQLRVNEEQGEATRTARQAEIVIGLNATATAYNQDAAGLIQLANAEATATVTAANAAAVEATARRDSSIAWLTVAALGALLFMGIIAVGAAVYPTLARVVLQERASEARVTITDNPMPPLTIGATTAEVLPPPERAPIAPPTSGLRPVQDSPRPVQDETIAPPEPFLNERDVLTEEDERRIVAAFGTHRALSQTAAAVFGAANGRRSAIVKAVLIKHGVFTPRGEQVTA